MINFASAPLLRRQRSNLLLLFILVLVLAFMIFENQKMQQKLTNLSLALEKTDQPQVFQLPITERDIYRSDLAKKIYSNITFPWPLLFTGLEEVKKGHKKIHYKVIAPVKSESVILLTAEADSIREMLAFIGAIETHQAFSHARLINQNSNDDGILEFTVKIGWKI